MANYTGSKCISCGEVFKESDDIVVCPECGTPYHRECYLKEGKCINEQLHDNGQSWNKQEEQETAEETSEGVRCIRCGFENSAEKLFCEKCGTPLMKISEEDRPFNTADGQANGSRNAPFGAAGQGNPVFGGQMVFDKNSEIEGITLDDYAKYVGGNPLGFLSNFIRFGKFGGKASLNVFAFIFPELYFLYRKMKPWGVIALLAAAVLAIPGTIEYLVSGIMGVQMDLGIEITSKAFVAVNTVSWYIMLIIKILSGLFANYLYYKQAKKDINDIRNEDIPADESEIKMKIAAKGGTSWAAVIVGFTVYSIIMFGSVILIGKLV